MTVRAFVLLFALFAAVLLAWTPEREARAIERNFAGSVQLDYHFVPTQKQADSERFAFDGFTTEAAVKVAADLTDHLSANVKVCFGCHGFELDMAYLDFRAKDELTIRFGRFSPSFGSFNIRHDVANHRLSDKPLPYDMGRMLRLRSWGLSVLPSPFPDNGVEVNGTHWFGEKAQFDYAAYAVIGFKGSETATDIDFKESRQLYYVDKNARPTVGGRMALTYKLGAASDVTWGASAMYGAIDPQNQLSYLILGSDLVFRFGKTNLRFEYLVRRQEFDTSNPAAFKYEIASPRGDFFAKHGAYVEIEQPLSNVVDLIVRVDGMYRQGNVLAYEPLLSAKSSVIRYTLGSSFMLDRSLRLKVSTEAWQWSDEDPKNGNKLDVGVHAAAVASF